MRLILMDVDGVLANFISGLIATHGWDITHDQWTSWDHHRTLGVHDGDMWGPTEVEGWWAGLPPYRHAEDLMNMFRDEDVVFCTSPSLHHQCASEKIDWLRKHGFMPVNKNAYMIGPRKDLLAGSGGILIDDSQSNVDRFRAAGGKAILFPQPWNVAENRRHSPLGYVSDMLDSLG